MKSRLIKASDYSFEQIVDVETFEDLKRLDEAHGDRGLIIQFHNKRVPEITIYDDYIE